MSSTQIQDHTSDIGNHSHCAVTPRPSEKDPVEAFKEKTRKTIEALRRDLGIEHLPPRVRPKKLAMDWLNPEPGPKP